MKPSERAPYSAIVDRPPLKLPDGVRLVVWPIVNLEVWEIERAMARQVLPAPTGVAVIPDLPNWSWHEYGMRVGIWRFFAAFERRGIVPTLSINAKVTESYPRVSRAALESGWEFMGHGYMQMPIHAVDDQRALIHQSLETLERFTGRRPIGWLGPGLTETYDTPDLLVEAGIKYVGDWVYDDEPTELRTTHGPLVTLPYTVELNDIPMMIVQHHTAEEFFIRSKAQFDRLYAESATRAKILSFAIHPYITGVPHRIGQLEAFLDYATRHPGVVFWTGEQILAWYLGSTAHGNGG